MNHVGTAAFGCPAERSSAFIVRPTGTVALHPRVLPGPTGFQTGRTKIKLSAGQLQSPPSAEPAHSFLDPHSRTRRCPPPEFPRPPVPHRQPCRAICRHPPRYGSAVAVPREFRLSAAFCAL